MVDITPRSGGIEISGPVGGTKGRVGISRDVVSLGIDVAGVKLGITSDYGGAATIGLGGQSITLGTQGGNIKLGVGGFEVKVEARNCVVTETKTIFGQVVARRTYPDSGCKQPEESAASAPTPGSVIDLPDTDEEGWVIYNVRFDYYEWAYAVKLRSSLLTVRTVTDIEKPISRNRLPFTVTSKQNRRGPDYTVTKGTYVDTEITYKTTDAMGTSHFVMNSHPVTPSAYYDIAAFYGQASKIKKWISTANQANERNVALGIASGWYTGESEYRYYFPTDFIPLVPGKKKQFLPTGNQPMPQNCCPEVLAELEDIREVLGVDRLLKDKFPFSNMFMAPGVDAASQTQAKNYYEIAQCLVRMMAHGMIFEPKVKIKDGDAAKAGDQEFKAEYINATGWASSRAEAILEIRDDGNVATNMDLRNGFTVTQMMVAVADIVEKVDTVLDCLGVKTQHKLEVVTTAFNCVIQIGKGFGPENERQLDLNEDTATEELLPEFLKTRDNKLKTVEIHSRSQTILEVLQSIQKQVGNHDG